MVKHIAKTANKWAAAGTGKTQHFCSFPQHSKHKFGMAKRNSLLLKLKPEEQETTV